MLRALVLELSLPKGSVVVDFCIILETFFFIFFFWQRTGGKRCFFACAYLSHGICLCASASWKCCWRRLKGDNLAVHQEPGCPVHTCVSGRVIGAGEWHGPCEIL